MALKGRTIMVQGRVIWAVGGNLFKGKPLMDKRTGLPKLDKNQKPLTNRGFGLAVDKRVLQIPANLAPGAVGEFWQALYDEAWTLYPDRNVPKNFAWKRIDGDTDTTEEGVPWNRKEGYAGHYVLPCTTNLDVAFYRFMPGAAEPTLINEGIKVGDYVQVQLNVVAHPPIEGGKPGLYLNPLSVLFLAPGQAIITQPDGADIFGTSLPSAPMGAVVVPDTTPQMGQIAQMPGAPAPAGQYQQPAPQYAQPQAQQFAPPAAPQPHYDVVPQHLHPQAQQQQFAPPPQQAAAPVQQYAPPPQQQYQGPPAGNWQQPAPAVQQQQFAPPAGAPMPPGFQQR